MYNHLRNARYFRFHYLDVFCVKRWAPDPVINGRINGPYNRCPISIYKYPQLPIDFSAISRGYNLHGSCSTEPCMGGSKI